MPHKNEKWLSQSDILTAFAAAVGFGFLTYYVSPGGYEQYQKEAREARHQEFQKTLSDARKCQRDKSDFYRQEINQSP